MMIIGRERAGADGGLGLKTNGGDDKVIVKEKNRKDIVILGAGYGGMRTALRLERVLDPSRYRIVVIDQYRHHQIITRLHEVVGGRTPAYEAAIPVESILRGRQIEFVMGRVIGFDFPRRMVLTQEGGVPYHCLVIALGSETEFYGIPGMREHAFTLKSLHDACLIHSHIREVFAEARQKRGWERRSALTFVVGGGGFTGTELASELVELIRGLTKEYDISGDEVRILLVEAGSGLLPGLHRALAKRAGIILERKGVGIILGSPVVGVGGEAIRLKSGEEIPTRTVIWTGGVRAPAILGQSGLKTGAAGRVMVTPYLEVVDYPQVYTIGDSALILSHLTGRPSPPSAQLAVQQAEVAARNIWADLTGRSPERYTPRIEGEAISLGPGNGVAWLGPFRGWGFPAHLLKVFIAQRYLYSLGGLQMLSGQSRWAGRELVADFQGCLLLTGEPGRSLAGRASPSPNAP